MLDIVIVVSVLAAMIVAASFANAQLRHRENIAVRVVGHVVGKVVVCSGYAFARVRYPEAFVDTERVRYVQWLEDHAEDTAPTESVMPDWPGFTWSDESVNGPETGAQC